MSGKKKSIVREVSQLLGINPTVCYLFIKVIRNHVIKELKEKGESAVLGVGVFTLSLGKYVRVNFRASKVVLNDIKNDNFIERDLSGGLGGELADDITKRRNKLFFDTLKAPRATMPISRNFAYYLKNRFPLGECWIHPHTKQEYSASEVRKVLETYQSIEPEGYTLLWAIWVSIEARRLIIRKSNMSPDELVARWYETIDSVLFILFNPELTPVKLKETPVVDNPDPRPPIRYRKRIDYYLSPFMDDSTPSSD